MKESGIPLSVATVTVPFDTTVNPNRRTELEDAELTLNLNHIWTIMTFLLAGLGISLFGLAEEAAREWYRPRLSLKPLKAASLAVARGCLRWYRCGAGVSWLSIFILH